MTLRDSESSSVAPAGPSRLRGLQNALNDCLDVIEPVRDELRKQGKDDAATACDEVIAYARSVMTAPGPEEPRRSTIDHDAMRLWDIQKHAEQSIAIGRELNNADWLYLRRQRERAVLAALAERLEHHYDFACTGGPLKNCVEWQELKALVGPAPACEPRLQEEDLDPRVEAGATIPPTGSTAQSSTGDK